MDLRRRANGIRWDTGGERLGDARMGAMAEIVR